MCWKSSSTTTIQCVYDGGGRVVVSVCWGGGGTDVPTTPPPPGTFLYQALKKFNERVVYMYISILSLWVSKNVSSYTTTHPCDGLQKYDMGYNDYGMIFFALIHTEFQIWKDFLPPYKNHIFRYFFRDTDLTWWMASWIIEIPLLFSFYLSLSLSITK